MHDFDVTGAGARRFPRGRVGRVTAPRKGFEERWLAGVALLLVFVAVPAFAAVPDREVDGEHIDVRAAQDGRQHFYQTRWFFVACGIAVVLLGLGLHGLKLRSVRARNLALVAEIRAREREEAERSAAQEERLHAEKLLRESTKLEAVGRLAGGIAHDFNNVLTTILGHADLLGVDLKSSAPHLVTRHTDQIVECCQRATALTRQLLAFSRQQILKPEPLDPNKTLLSLETMLRHLIPETIELHILPEPDCGWLMADRSQLEQVVMNLVLNARDAMPDGGTLTVETQAVTLSEAYASRTPEASVGRHVQITVSDTGIGMGESILDHVFEPFFTTKGPKGTGLGLASTHGIVRQSGGHILVYSEPSEGTTFKVYLPAVDPTEGERRPAPAIVDEIDGTETILICDDYEAVRRTAHEALIAHGYRVYPAADPKEAIELARGNGPIDLLITDVVMSEMKGPELARHIAEIHPAVQVLFISGYTANTIVHQGVVDKDIDFLAKPFHSADLLQIVRTILNRAREDTH